MTATTTLATDTWTGDRTRSDTVFRVRHRCGDHLVVADAAVEIEFSTDGPGRR